MKISYSYKSYSGYPEATEISHRREKLKNLHAISAGWGLIFSIIALIADFNATWFAAIPLGLFCIASFVYLIKYYDSVTDRKIAKAIAKRNELIKKKVSEEYRCLYIYRLDNYKRGRCHKCSTFSENLRECMIKDRYVEGSVFLCNSCIMKYHQNIR